MQYSDLNMWELQTVFNDAETDPRNRNSVHAGARALIKQGCFSMLLPLYNHWCEDFAYRTSVDELAEWQVDEILRYCVLKMFPSDFWASEIGDAAAEDIEYLADELFRFLRYWYDAHLENYQKD